MEFKQAILIRADLNMSAGKIAAQAAHASLEAALKVMAADELLKNAIFKEWKRQGMKKVVLKVSSEKELFDYKAAAERAGIKSSLIKDAGLTEIEPGTVTAVAIGPDSELRVDKIVGHLRAL